MGSENIEHGVTLTPAQSAAKEFLRKGLEVASVLALGGETGRGKSTVLAELHSELGGSLIGISDLLKETGTRHPLALEECVVEVVLAALKRADVVIVDHFGKSCTKRFGTRATHEWDGWVGLASLCAIMPPKPARS